MTLSLIKQQTGMSEQRGSTLLVALVMLVLLTLTAISAMNASTSSIQVVGNAQFRAEANAVAQQAIERVISNKGFTVAPPVQQLIDINGDGSNDFKVVFTPAPVCISHYYADPNLNDLDKNCKGLIKCDWTVWDITAVVTDLKGSGATSTIHQGIRVIQSQVNSSVSC